MAAWSKVRPITFSKVKGKGLVASEFPEYVAFADDLLAQADPEVMDASDPPWLVLRCANGVATYRLLQRNGETGQTLAQRESVEAAPEGSPAADEGQPSAASDDSPADPPEGAPAETDGAAS